MEKTVAVVEVDVRDAVRVCALYVALAVLAVWYNAQLESRTWETSYRTARFDLRGVSRVS